MIIEFEAPLWEWDARQESWTFVSLPADVSEDITHLTAGLRRGFGAVKVRAAIGRSEWSTSIFRTRRAGRTYCRSSARSGRRTGWSWAGWPR